MGMNSSIHLEVPALDTCASQACWYTSLKMILAYHRSRNPDVAQDLVDPANDPQTRQLYAAHAGPGEDDGERIARRLGFAVGEACENADDLAEMMDCHGPVIFGGRRPGDDPGHWIVLHGVTGDRIHFSDPSGGEQTMAFDELMGDYRHDEDHRPLIFAP